MPLARASAGFYCLSYRIMFVLALSQPMEEALGGLPVLAIIIFLAAEILGS